MSKVKRMQRDFLESSPELNHSKDAGGKFSEKYVRIVYAYFCRGWKRARRLDSFGLPADSEIAAAANSYPSELTGGYEKRAFEAGVHWFIERNQLQRTAEKGDE